MAKRKILRPGEHVVVAWAEHCAGPGWSNRLVNIIVRCADGSLRQTVLQPEEMTREMMTLFNVSASVTTSMTGWTNHALMGKVNP